MTSTVQQDTSGLVSETDLSYWSHHSQEVILGSVER